jgi:hypothetical protein
MELRCLVRAHIGAYDDAHAAAVHREDADGHLGVSLSKDLLKAAVRAFSQNLRRDGRHRCRQEEPRPLSVYNQRKSTDR